MSPGQAMYPSRPTIWGASRNVIGHHAGSRGPAGAAHRGHDSVTEEPPAATETEALSCSTLDRPELGPRLFGRDLQLVDLAAVLLGELDEFVLGSLRGPAALALHRVLHAYTSSRAGY